MQSNITVHGLTDENVVSEKGKIGCKQTLHVTNNGRDVYIPFIDIRRDAHYWFDDRIPERFDADRLIPGPQNENIHAIADIEVGVIELVAFDGWRLDWTPDHGVEDYPILYEHDHD